MLLPVNIFVSCLLLTRQVLSDTSCQGQADILLIVDESGSIGSDNFDQVLDFLADFSGKFSVGKDFIHFSELTFSDKSTVVFDFNKYQTNDTLKKAILSTSYNGGSTNTGEALNKARTFAFTSANGARSNVSKLALVLTDGQSNDRSYTVQEAGLLKNSGVIVVAIGVGSQTDDIELKAIATSPSYVYNVKNFQGLDSIIYNVSNTVCRVQTEAAFNVSSLLCFGRKNGDYPPCSSECADGFYYSCVNEVAFKRQCKSNVYVDVNKQSLEAKMVFEPALTSCQPTSQACPRSNLTPSITPTVAPVQSCQGKADILLIVDESGSIGLANFNQVLSFLADFSTKFAVGKDTIHFSGLKFSDASTVVFDFNKYLTNDTLKKAILSTSYNGGSTSTGEALNKARTFAFTSANGARSDVPKLALVLTDGQSNDRATTMQEASLLKNSGVTVFAIGVGTGIDYKELQSIATAPSYVFNVSNFQGLEAIINNVSNTICKVQTDVNINTVNVSSLFCLGRRDGDYPACLSDCVDGYYYTCARELVYKKQCNLGTYTNDNKQSYTDRMVYDPITRSCQLKSVACPRSPPTTAAPPSTTTTTTTTTTPRPTTTTPTTTTTPMTTTTKPTTTTTSAVSTCQGRADILFVIDESGSILKENFNQVLKFLADFAFQFSVGNDSVHFSELTFSDVNKLYFDFTKYLTNSALRKAILNTTYAGGQTNTGAALNLARTVAFTSANGARSDVPKIALVVTDGHSSDRTVTLKEAELLKNSGVIVLTIGIGPEIDNKELQAISTSPLFVYKVSTFKGLQNILYNVSNTVCKVQNEVNMNAINISSLVCLGRKDGDYPACSSECVEGYYYTCVRERAFKRQCNVSSYLDNNNRSYSARMVFEPATRTCQQSSKSCPRSHPNPVILRTASQDVTPARFTECIPSNCQGKADGDYPACSPECQLGYYYSCVNEYAYQRTCALRWQLNGQNELYTERLLYNPTTGSCEYSVPSCTTSQSN